MNYFDSQTDFLDSKMAGLSNYTNYLNNQTNGLYS